MQPLLLPRMSERRVGEETDPRPANSNNEQKKKEHIVRKQGRCPELGSVSSRLPM